MSNLGAVLGGILRFDGTPLAALGVLVWIPIVVTIDAGMSIPRLRDAYRRSPWIRFAGIQVLLWAVLLYGSDAAQQFIYFEF
jgi:hypothetical protein